MAEQMTKDAGGKSGRAGASGGRFFGGLAAGLAAAYVVVCGLPAIAASLSSIYRFDLQMYLQVLIPTNHRFETWFQKGPGSLIILAAIVLGPLAGGLVFHLLRLRGRALSAAKGRDIGVTAVTFAAGYALAALAFAALAALKNPFPFDPTYFLRDQVGIQLLTLAVLALAMGAAGAAIAERFSGLGRRRPAPADEPEREA